MRVDLFPTLDQAGSDLADTIEAAVHAARPEAGVRRQLSTTPFAVERSVLGADVVVLDLTPAPAGTHRYTTMNYPWQRDHVLAVSRTYLPINVAPVRAGGAGIYPRSLSDDQIATWVAHQLTGPNAVRPTTRRHRLLHRMSRPAAREPAADIFLSYRGVNLPEAQALRTDLESGRHHRGVRQRVHLFLPGELASSGEVLPAVLRWNILATISDVIHTCREIWILDTPEYLASWWTQGELVCRPYFGTTTTVYAHDPATGRTTTADPRFETVLTGAQRKRMARMFVNSHPDEMGPESSATLRRLTSTGWRYVNDEAFAEEFSTVPLLQCPGCSFGDGLPTSVDVTAFLENAAPRLYPVSPSTLDHATTTGAPLPCPNCGTAFTVTQAPPRYLWFALPTGEHKSFLEAVPTWFAHPVA